MEGGIYTYFRKINSQKSKIIGMMSDKLLNFLNNCPDKWILFIVCLFVTGLFLYIQDDFTRQLLNTVISALLGLLIRRSSSDIKNETNINTGTNETSSNGKEGKNNLTNKTSNNENLNNNILKAVLDDQNSKEKKLK